MDLRLAPATAADLPGIAVADARAFGISPDDPALTDELALLDPVRFLLARDGEIIAGVTGHFGFDITVPGGASVPIPGVSWVSVGTTHRRRGVLRELMRAQHEAFVDAGVVMSALVSTAGGIYGRFGYGPATVVRDVEIDRTQARFRPSAPDPGGVWEAEAGEARAHVVDVHERWRRQVPGALARPDGRWDLMFADREQSRGGASALFFLLHADGYAAYRVDRARCRAHVVELVAVTDDAHAALWRILLGLDMVDWVTMFRAPPDDPLPFLLTDPRLVRTTAMADGMWLRLIDIPAALAARTYAVELDVVCEVTDDFLGRGGRFRLRGGPEGAECVPVDRPPDVGLDVGTLGALYLGGHRATTLARAALLRIDDTEGADGAGAGGAGAAGAGAAGAGAAALPRRLDAAFGTERAPHHGTHF